MKTQIISGSHRLQSQSLKVSHFLQKEIEKKGHTAGITDLSRGSLPLWDERVWESDPQWTKIWAPIADQLRAADSFVVVVPEYAGMAPPALKNFFLFCTNDLMANKPGLLVSVSAGINGAYPIAEMRASSYKNCHLNYIPDHIIVREAPKILNDAPATDPRDKMNEDFILHRIQYGIAMLEQYSKALKMVRESGIPNYKDFGNGM